MPDPLTSELIGGPLDGATILIHPAAGILVGISGENGATYNYVMRPIVPGKLEYVETVHAKAVPLKGGLDPMKPAR